MVIDIKTALNFIDIKFKNYTDREYINSGTNIYKFNKLRWSCKNIHNCTLLDDKIDILDMDRVCIWNHHNLYDEHIVKSLNTRSLHLLECLNEKPDSLLLFYIEKIQNYEGTSKDYFDINILDKYNCNFLILIPLFNFI